MVCHIVSAWRPKQQLYAQQCCHAHLTPLLCLYRFVWGKKIERDLLKGTDVREFTAAAVQRKHEERMVSNTSRELQLACAAVGCEHRG